MAAALWRTRRRAIFLMGGGIRLARTEEGAGDICMLLLIGHLCRSQAELVALKRMAARSEQRRHQREAPAAHLQGKSHRGARACAHRAMRDRWAGALT